VDNAAAVGVAQHIAGDIRHPGLGGAGRARVALAGAVVPISGEPWPL
jgi:hypothetical protein